MRHSWFCRLALLVCLVLFGLVPAPHAAAQVGGAVQNDAGIKAIGLLPPTREGVARILLRALTSTDENGEPVGAYPRVRVYHGTTQVACSDVDCTEGGVVATATAPDAADSLHLGIVIDDTLNFASGQSVADAVCSALLAVRPANASFSAWRIGDSTGAASIAGPSRSIDDFCSALQAQLTGRTRAARSPIYQVVQGAVSSMAGDTINGVRRELLVISDGVDETCVGAPDVAACTNDRVNEIVATAIANSIPVSVLLVDSSQAGRSVALHQGSTLRTMGSSAHGVVRSVSLAADQNALNATLSRMLRAMQAVAVVPIECLSVADGATTVGLRVSAITGDGAAARVSSTAERILAAPPLACASQRELCEAAGAMCTPNANSANNVGRFQQRQRSGGTTASTNQENEADAGANSAANDPAGDDSGTNTAAEAQEASEGSAATGEASGKLSKRQLFLYGAIGLALLLIAVAVVIWRRDNAADEAPSPSVWNESSQSAAAPAWPSSNSSAAAQTPDDAIQSPPPPSWSATNNEAGTPAAPRRGDTIDEAGGHSAGARGRTVDEMPGVGAHGAPRFVEPRGPLASLRTQRSHAASIGLAALGADGRAAVLALPRDEYARVAVDAHGMRAVAAPEAMLLARFDTGARAVEVRPGPQSVLFVNRAQVADRAWVQPGDVLHCGASRVPVEVRSGSNGGSVTGVVLEPLAAGTLNLPRVQVGAAEVRIGRDPENPPGWEHEFGSPVALPLANLADAQRRRVSNDHVEVWISQGVAYVRDLSSNGTLVDGARIPKGVPVAVQHGTELRLSEDVAYRIVGQA